MLNIPVMLLHGMIMFLVFCSICSVCTSRLASASEIDRDVNDPIQITKCGPIQSEIPESVAMSEVGEKCTLKNGKPGIKMINDTFKPDCLPCCEDHFWNAAAKLCQPCPRGTSRREGIFPNCLPSEPGKSPTVTTPLEGINPGSVRSTSSTGPDYPKIHKPKAPQVSQCTATSVVVQWCFFCLPYEKIEIQLFENFEEGEPTIFSVSASTNSYTLGILKPNSRYCIRMRGTDKNNTEYSLWSDGVTFVTKAVLETPSNFQVSVEDGVITASWKMKRDENKLKKQLKYMYQNKPYSPVFITYGTEFQSPVMFSLPYRRRYDISMSYIDQDGRNSPWTAHQKIHNIPGTYQKIEEKNCSSTSLVTCVVICVCLSVCIGVTGYVIYRMCRDTSKSHSNDMQDTPLSSSDALCSPLVTSPT